MIKFHLLNLLEVNSLKKCAVCGKSVQFGNNVSHSKRATKRVWRPNLQKASIMLEGEKVKARVCTKCLKKVERV